MKCAPLEGDEPVCVPLEGDESAEALAVAEAEVFAEAGVVVEAEVFAEALADEPVVLLRSGYG